MEVYWKTSENPVVERGSVVTFGSFDGVHLGHQALVHEVVEQSQRQGLTSVVMSFDPHPVQVLYPNRGLKRMFPVEDQLDQMQRLGVDVFLLQKFDYEFSRVTAEAFLSQYLFEKLKLRTLVLGPDSRFGVQKQGDFSFIEPIAERLGVEVVQCAPAQFDGQTISSSRIREALLNADFSTVRKMLKRPYSISGVVVAGQKRGRQLGVPTANIELPDLLFPPNGVYLTRVRIRGHLESYEGISNLGVNPTFSEGERLKLETHILDQSLDLYGETLLVEILCKLRDERKFSGPDELRVQIRADIERARELHQQNLI